MGQVKQSYIEAEERGFNDPPEKLVCANHFDDPAIKRYIRSNSIKGTWKCDYCNKKHKVVDLLSVVSFINDRVGRYFGDINNQDLYLASSFEIEDDEPSGFGFYDACGYAMPKGRHTYSFEELIFETDLDINNLKLSEDISECFWDKTYCLIEPFISTESEELLFRWKDFCNTIKHSRRYTFLKTLEVSNKKSSENGLEDILTEIGKAVEEGHLIRIIDCDSQIYRCRVHNKDEKVDRFEHLASPPDERAKQNRMSPAGISMFYGAFDEKTAIIEVKSGMDDTPDSITTTAIFKTKKKLRVIDFTGLQNKISYYEDYNYYIIEFLKSFVNGIAQKIIHDDRIHIEYIPTQIITEYFRYIFKANRNHKVDGLIYRSSENKGGKCCVLFLDRNKCPDYMYLSSII
ncbi:MAG: RES domain-containing protein [Paludibacter sp.]|nr:RES domain-containing protein [Paludibacter sp.]